LSQIAISLVEAGFEYVTGEYNDGGKILRKRKLEKHGVYPKVRGV